MEHNTPGFQGSETTSVEVTAYHRGDDPIILFSDPGARTFRGRRNQDPDASITAVQTNKAMGSSSGSFSVTLKPSELMGRTLPDFREYLVDDDWIDISFSRNGVPTHVMRGLIEDVTLTEGVASTGATDKTYTLSGRDFGAVFDKTKVWFNRVAAELGRYAALKVFDGPKAIGNPADLVERIVYGFMGALEDKGRANWLLPQGMPGAAPTFAETFLFDKQSFTNDPPRNGVSAQLMDPNGQGIWQLAQEYSDPMFCELYCDLGRGDGGELFPGLTSTPNDTSMVLRMRDRPFPRLDQGKDSPWFNLPVLEVPRTHVSRKKVTRSTKDRFNAYFVAPQTYQEGGFTKDLLGPLWDEEDIRLHGFRPFNVQSRYTATESNLFNLIAGQRERVRDWHCLGPYFLAGDVGLARCYPDARIGHRLRINGASEGEQEDYYIESVGQSWTQQQGAKTTLGVTRGWVGGDNAYLRALSDIVARYATVAL